MKIWAMFVKINDKWLFSGLTEHEELVSEFEEEVRSEIEITSEMAVKTTDYCSFPLEGQYAK